jgi:glycosyltransferase involved in cell wall biosynthesis
MPAHRRDAPTHSFSPLPETIGTTPLVSVIVPCRNERGYIIACLESIRLNDYPADRLQVLVVDGRSDDGTRELLQQYVDAWQRVRWLDNPARTAPAALNIGIQQAEGDVIMRMDAHCRYPRNYISVLVGWLKRSGADNVGAAWRTLPGAETPLARAIAVALAHPFGVGNAHFRLGITEPKWVDTVPFGCYRRSVFARVGLFDEELIRNQDDEFNQRLLRSGGRILLVPDATIDYFARDSIGKLARMYYQYGYFKPLAAKKVGHVGTLRQAVPAAFALCLIVVLLLSLANSRWLFAFGALASAYLLAAVVSSITAINANGLGVGLLTAAVFPVIHFSYAVGSLRGAGRILFRRDKAGNSGDRVEGLPISR